MSLSEDKIKINNDYPTQPIDGWIQSVHVRLTMPPTSHILSYSRYLSI